MNIIQVQDRLKGVTDDALIGYVENPTGQVPTYLALGEIGRRENMRKEYQAQPQPNQTVAEEMVAQLSTPTGIGALTSNMGAQLPPEEVMSSSETISETGVANLPTPNIGQNYQAGGIVYSDGTQGYPIGGLIVPGLAAAGRYGGRGLNYLKNKLFTGKPPVKGPAMNLPTGTVSPILKSGTPGLLKRPGTYIDTAVIGGVAYGIYPDGTTEEIVDNEEVTTTDAGTEKIEKTTEDVLTTPAKTMADRTAEFRAMMGESEYGAKLKERLATMDERAVGREEDATNMMLIEGGLAMAGGKSQNFLENAAAGGQKMVESYSDSLDAIEKADEKQFMLMGQLEQADRAVKLAAVQYGVNSEQFEIAEANKQAIQNQKNQLTLLTENMKSRRAIMPTAKDYNTAYNDVLDNDMIDFDTYAQDKGKRFTGSPQYKKERENYIQQRIQQRLFPGSEQAVAQEGFSAVEITG